MNGLTTGCSKGFCRIVLSAFMAVLAMGSAMAEDLPYGLKAGKPYEGTKLTYPRTGGCAI